MGKLIIKESQLTGIIAETVRRVLREYDEFSGNTSVDLNTDTNRLSDYDKGGKTSYIFFDELKGENGFSVENDLGVVKNNLPYSVIRNFMLKNKNTMYLDEIIEFNNFNEFLRDYQIKKRRSHSKNILNR